MKLEYYNSLSEVEGSFDVEYIDNSYSFNCLIEQLQKEENSLYRGVSSPRYKMYSSAQRFYLADKESMPMSYSDFLKKLYEISKELGNGELLSLYDKVRNDNYVQYVNVNTDKIEKEKAPLDYNPIWAFYTLQHITECSPFLDFSKNFFIALYFASQKISPIWCDNFSKSIDSYIEIISLNEKTELFNEPKLGVGNKYVSLTDEIFGDGNHSIDGYQNALFNYDGKSIKYISYGGNSSVLEGKGYEYKFSLANENCIVQSGRSFLTSIEENKTFEQVWNDVFQKSPKLKAYLIRKSLATDIFQNLTIHLLGKVLVPIQKDYKDEIKRRMAKV